MKNSISPCRIRLLLLAHLAFLPWLPGCQKSSESAGPPDYAVSAVIAAAEERSLEEKVLLVGSLATLEEVDLVSEIDARVVGLNFEEGVPVEAGQWLIQLDKRKLEASLAEMRARYDLAKANLERSANLLARQTISQQDYDQAAAEFDSAGALLLLAEEQLADATIVAPFNGVMTERLISLGQFTSRGEVLASLVAVDPLELHFNVPERTIGQLSLGQSIAFSVEAYPGSTFHGQVAFLSPRVDQRSRTLLVKARVANADHRLKPGMFGRLELAFTAREKALVIPESALSYADDKSTVVVMNAEDRAEFREVEVGLRLAGEAEILAGLEAGERVVVEGFQKLGPGSRISISDKSSRYGIVPEAPAQPDPAQ